jgi:pimeloyl-ACP methyl ester carboxylesterase
MPLLAKDRLVIAMDNPGYGESSLPEREYAIVDFATTGTSLLDHLGVEKASVMGHHTGAFIAMEMAAAYPNRVDNLILSFPLPLLDDAERKIGFKTIIGDYCEQFQMKPDGSHLTDMWRNLYERVATTATLDLVNRATLDAMKAMAHGDPCFALRAVFNYRMEDRLPLIQCPTLILWGIRDLELHDQDWGFHSLQNKQQVSDEIPRCKTIEYTGPQSTATMINTMPDEIGGAILDFLREPGV